jgi:hypothetical protein
VLSDDVAAVLFAGAASRAGIEPFEHIVIIKGQHFLSQTPSNHQSTCRVVTDESESMAGGARRKIQRVERSTKVALRASNTPFSYDIHYIQDFHVSSSCESIGLGLIFREHPHKMLLCFVDLCLHDFIS